MTFRMRLTALTAFAVAIAIVGASLVVYYSYRQETLRQVDGELGASLTVAPVKKLLTERVIEPRSVQVVLPSSATAIQVKVLGSFTVSPAYIAAVGPFHYATTTVNGVPERQLTILGEESGVTVTRSLVDVNQSLAHLRWLLLLTCVGGIGAATLLGALVSGRAITRLRRLTEAAERITATGVLSERTGQTGRDEVSRLSAQLDALLATLEESVRTQRQLVADASHELRTPITTMRANVELLAQSDSLDPDERAELIADVRDELAAMSTLVGELVELAHGEEVDIASGEFRFDEVVQSAVDRAAKRTQSVVFRASLEPTVVRGVPERVERAVDNLLDNACKWSPPGEVIDVSVQNGVLQVRDRGPGIAAEDLPLVFNRFYRSRKARGTPGSGLGLAIVKQIADAHDGSVTADDAPDGGAIFRLTLLPSR